MAKLPPRDDDEVKPRNKRRYDPRDQQDEKAPERGVPRKSGGRPQDDEDDWEDDWELEDEDLEDEDLDDDFEDDPGDEDWSDEDSDPDDDDR